MPEPERSRPTPEQLLKQVEAEERHQRHGKLKVFLGYASGVGKSFRMLDEGRRRKARGQDVVVAAVQQQVPDDIDEILKNFEVIPPRLGLASPCIDVDAVRRRRPSVCLIDGLAHRNPPGCRNPERWQDVEELLADGISVITTINLQYIREKQQQVEAIRGKTVSDAVPESFVRRADEIEIMDAPPEYCVTRTEEGDRISEDRAARLQHQLSELREIALVLVAEVVDHQLEDYLRRQGIEQSFGTHERILVCVTPRSNASLMISRGKRQAERFHGELFVAYVEQDRMTPADRATLEQNLEEARQAQAHVEILHGEDPVTAILRFAEKQGVTQIFVGHSLRRGWRQSFFPNPVDRLILEADGMDIRIFPHGGETEAP
ncbi:MAG TPA: universal stress protein [Bryobacteraceae bacterium]|nr:universal stress protein [Bryobacteraceae bacterium]